MDVLFVDDESPVLRGLERALDAADVEWSTHFAESGQEALELMKAQEIMGLIKMVLDGPAADWPEEAKAPLMQAMALAMTMMPDQEEAMGRRRQEEG